MRTFEAEFIYHRSTPMRFLGSIEAKADAKGRVFLPASFRKMLSASGESNLVLRKDIFQPCLVLYPESVWNKMLDSLRARLNRWSRQDQMVFRQFVSDVEPITLDRNGRILISRRYLQKASITEQVRFIGMDDYIEIWNNDAATDPFMDADSFAQALEERMGDSLADCLGGSDHISTPQQ